MSEQIEPGEGWRLLGPDDVVKSRDEYWSALSKIWVQHDGYGGQKACEFHAVRRRIPAKPEAMPSLVDSVKRIRHFATGSCDMPLETRLKCIAKECEATLSKFDAEWREAQE